MTNIEHVDDARVRVVFDPESAFGQQIDAHPGDPLPRLIYADWCDENDRPDMAELQRWLAATGRFPMQIDGHAVWLTLEEPPRPETIHYSAHTLPYRLAIEIRVKPPTTSERSSVIGGVLRGMENAVTWVVFSFASPRQAEEELAEAWRRSRRRRQLLLRFRPTFESVTGTEPQSQLPSIAGAWVANFNHSGAAVWKYHATFLFCGALLVYAACDVEWRDWFGQAAVGLGISFSVGVAICVGVSLLRWVSGWFRIRPEASREH